MVASLSVQGGVWVNLTNWRNDNKNPLNQEIINHTKHVIKGVSNALQEWISVVETYQGFDIIDGKETSRSPTSACVPLTVQLLHHGHNISCSQSQLSWTLCVFAENNLVFWENND